MARDHEMYLEVSPKAARRYLRDIRDPGKQFYAKDGSSLKNMFDLYDFTCACNDDTLRHHVDGSRNDLAVWLRDVVLDEELAQRIEPCILREPMQYRILRRINFLVEASSRDLKDKKKAIVILEDAITPEEHFITRDGRTLRNLWELSDFLKTADEGTFAHHVNDQRNDIAEWVSTVHMDERLSESIRDSRDPVEMRLLIDLRVRLLEKMAEIEKEKRQAHYLLNVINAIRRG